MLCNCNYDKTKLLYKLTKAVGFIEKHDLRRGVQGAEA